MTDNLPQRTVTPSTMSAAEAAAKFGVDKSTIARAIRAGKLKASRNADGAYDIPANQRFRRRYSQRQQSSNEIVADIWSLLGEIMDKLTALEAHVGHE